MRMAVKHLRRYPGYAFPVGVVSRTPAQETEVGLQAGLAADADAVGHEDAAGKDDFGAGDGDGDNHDAGLQAPMGGRCRALRRGALSSVHLIFGEDSGGGRYSWST